MALYMTIDNEWELQRIFKDWNRDYYSPDGYKAILDYFEETDCENDTELDVIGICCDFTEYEAEELVRDYGADFEEWLDGSGTITDWMMDNGFESEDDMTDADFERRFAELNTKELHDEYIEGEIDWLKDRYYIVELDNGNYLKVGC